MRYLVVLLIILLSSCGFTPRFAIGTSATITDIIDSIETADKVELPNIDTWETTYYRTNLGSYETKFLYFKVKKRTHILSIDSMSNYYLYNYRVE